LLQCGGRSREISKVKKSALSGKEPIFCTKNVLFANDSKTNQKKSIENQKK
jgi:hypothetical protein